MPEIYVKKLMLDGTTYSNKSTNPYTFTASMVGNEVLQNYLTIVNGTQPSREVDDTTVGSVFHKGMEQMIKESNYMPEGVVGIAAEENCQFNLMNGWTISGTADLKVKFRQGLSIDIHDFKLTKMYAITMLRQQLPTHSYSKQLNVLMWLDTKTNTYGTPPVYRLYVDAFAKDAKAINGENIHNVVEIPNELFGDIEFDLTVKTNILQEHIESGEIPAICTDLWPRRMRNGTTVNTKCALYCSHGKAGKCPYYNPTTRETVARIANW